MSLKDDLQIVLITYNRAVLLTRTLEKILGNNSPIHDFDITILDNNSTDETHDVVKGFISHHQNLKYEKNMRNLGVNGNIIKAYLAGRKKYIWVLCDDDTYDFSNWSEVEEALRNNEEYIIVSRYALRNESSFAEQIVQASFVPASIIKTTLITDVVARNMIESAHTLFAYLQIFINFTNGGGKPYVLKSPIVNHGLCTDITDYSYTRGHNPDDLTLSMKSMTWTHGFALILKQLKDRDLQIRCFNKAIEQPDIFNGNWSSFYDHIVTQYHEPESWSAFYDVYTILDDQHKKELLSTLLMRYPEIKLRLERTIVGKDMIKEAKDPTSTVDCKKITEQYNGELFCLGCARCHFMKYICFFSKNKREHYMKKIQALKQIKSDYNSLSYAEKIFGRNVDIKSDKKIIEKTYNQALKQYEREISLYWQRTAYFVIFIGVSLTVYNETKCGIYLFAASFLSFLWYLSTLGAKYWQKNWEIHVQQLERLCGSSIFSTYLVKPKLIDFLGDHRFSVSRINSLIALFCSVFFLLNQTEISITVAVILFCISALLVKSYSVLKKREK